MGRTLNPDEKKVLDEMAVKTRKRAVETFTWPDNHCYEAKEGEKKYRVPCPSPDPAVPFSADQRLVVESLIEDHNDKQRRRQERNAPRVVKPNAMPEWLANMAEQIEAQDEEAN